MSADQDLVLIRNIHTGETEKVTPEVAGVLRNQPGEGWRVDTDAEISDLKAQIAQLEQQIDDLENEDPDGLEMPKTAAKRIDWIGDDPARATAAKADEQQLTTPRKSVLEHIDQVLNHKKEA